MRSTIPAGEARSMSTVRGLRCSVTLGSFGEPRVALEGAGVAAEAGVLSDLRFGFSEDVLDGETHEFRSGYNRHRCAPEKVPDAERPLQAGETHVSRRALLAAAGILLCTASAEAQIIRPQIRTSPAAFASLGIGWLQLNGFCDKSSGDCWGFSMNVGAPQWRVSVELPLGYGGTTWGIVGTTSRYPLTYVGSGLSANSCLRCD